MCVSSSGMNAALHSRGNTSSCTIPLCLADMDGQLPPGNRLGLCTFGGGFTFGAAILEVNSQTPAQAQTAVPNSGAFSITAETVIPNTVIMDVTDNPEWMERARWLTAEAYVALANPKIRIGLEDVYDVVSGDVYEQPGRSRTFAALTTDPQSGCTKISGTLRLVWGKKDENFPDVPAIDAMNFVEPIQDWPHKQNGWADDEIGEIGRFFIPERYRTLAMRRSGVAMWLSRQLFEAAAELAWSQRVKVLYSVMPPYVARLFPGIPFEEVESGLKTSDPSAAAVFEQFNLYWQRSGPKLYQLTANPPMAK
jgi:hypothetical protein